MDLPRAEDVRIPSRAGERTAGAPPTRALPSEAPSAEALSSGALSTERLAEALGALGVRSGGVLFVQCSLRSLGVVRGGVHAVAGALRRALGPGGTLVVYTATMENSTTSRVNRRRLRGMSARQTGLFWHDIPPFDPRRTPASRSVGLLAETVRLLPGALRSAHPQTSFAAVGPLAHAVVDGHALTSHLGEQSPLARLYELDAQTLLIGIPLGASTVLHLADHRAGRMGRQMYSCKVLGADGAPRWVSFTDAALDDLHFPELAGLVAPRLRSLRAGPVGAAACLLADVRELVDEAARVPL